MNRSRTLGRLLRATTAAMGLLGHSTILQAQNSDSAAPIASTGERSSAGLEEVTVTAEREVTNIQSTALSIDAISGDALREQQIAGVEDLAPSLPNVSFGRIGADAKIYIRGVGYDSVSTGGETRVALYDDGIYQSRSQAAFAGFYDVERVEVLRGPQGTLYGRNATAGAINILTRDPSTSLEGYVSGNIGNYNLVGFEGGVGGPLAREISGRIAFSSTDRDGYGKNIESGEEVNDNHSRGVRGKLKFDFSDTLSLLLNANYSREKDHNGGYHYIGAGRADTVPQAVLFGQAPSDPQDISGAGTNYFLELYGVSGTLEWNPSSGTRLFAISGYNHVASNLLENFDGTNANLSINRLIEKSDTFSQEFRLQQEIGAATHVIAGVYYFHEGNSAWNLSPLNGVGFGLPNQLYQGYGTVGEVDTDAYAAFSQVTFDLTRKLGLSIGGRYSREEKTLDEAAQFDLTRVYSPGNPLVPFGSDHKRLNQSSFDPNVTLDYRFTDSIFGYATFSQGFKSGGFNIGGLQPPFAAEKLRNYEMGVKSEFFDRRFRANASAFYYDYRNLQVNVNEGVALITRNAAKARVTGLEAEFVALPVDDLRIELNLSYLNAEYLEFETIDDTFPERGVQNLEGNRLNNAPRYKVGADISYTFHTAIGKITPRATVNWVDRVYFSQFNLANVSQPARTELNAFTNIEFPDSDWSANLFVRNLTNDTYVVASTISSLFGYPVLGQYGAPRTFGLQLSKQF